MKKTLTKTKLAKVRREETIAPTLGVAAARLHLPAELLRTAKHMGCGAFKASGRVNLPELEQWFAEHPELVDSSEEMVGIVKENFLKAKADRQTKEHRLAVLTRSVIPAEEVRRSFTRGFVAARIRFTEAMQTSAQEIALHCGADEAKIQWALELVKKRTFDVLTELHRMPWMITACEHCGKELFPDKRQPTPAAPKS